MLSRPLIRYVLLAAFRDKLMITLCGMIALGAALGVFLGSAAMTEQSSFSTVFGSGGLRFLGVIGIVLFCCFYVRKSFETKEVEFLLSRPISRMTFLLSHAAAFIILAVIIALLVIAAVYFSGKPNPAGALLWAISLVVEYVIVAISALFFSMVLSSASGSALATLGLYVLSRLMGILIGIAKTTPDNMLFAVLNNAMELISVIVPRFDLMAQTTWLIYGVDGSAGLGFLTKPGSYAHAMVDTMGLYGFIGMQGIVFTALLIAAAAFDFSRREF